MPVDGPLKKQNAVKTRRYAPPPPPTGPTDGCPVLFRVRTGRGGGGGMSSHQPGEDSHSTSLQRGGGHTVGEWPAKGSWDATGNRRLTTASPAQPWVVTTAVRPSLPVLGGRTPPPPHTHTWVRAGGGGFNPKDALEEGGGVRDPKVCVPKIVRPDFPDGTFCFFPRWSLWSGGGGDNPPPSSEGVRPV